MQNRGDRHSTKLDELAFLHGKIKRKCEYSSITMRSYGLGASNRSFGIDA